MQVINNPSTSSLLPNQPKSSNTTAGASTSDKNTAQQSRTGRATEVQLSDVAREGKDLPRYLKPVEGYADPHASFGSIYDFLRPSDQKVLKEAYDYALSNGTSLEKVEEAAFYLGGQRRKQSQIATGTHHSVYVPEQHKAFVNAKSEDRAQELEKLIQNDPDSKFLNMLQRAEQGDFFGSNPILDQALFTDAVDNQLGIYRTNAITSEPTSTSIENQLFQHLRDSDNSELSKAYQSAKENNLDPEEVRKAALLLAVERMNENMSKSFSDNNSTAANAVKASSNMYQSIVDTPNKLIDLAQKVLGDDAAESFSNMVGQSRTEELFGRNSALRQALFLQPAYNLLNMMNKD